MKRPFAIKAGEGLKPFSHVVQTKLDGAQGVINPARVYCSVCADMALSAQVLYMHSCRRRVNRDGRFQMSLLPDRI